MAEITSINEGLLIPQQEKTYVYLPFDMPVDAVRLEVEFWYSDQIGSDPLLSGGNTIDLGIFDQRGVDFLTAGFRGWTGSERLTFFIAETESTPGYLAGPLLPGIWNVMLGLYKIAPLGCRYRLITRVTTEPGHVTAQPNPRLIGDLPSSLPPANDSPWLRGEMHCHTWHSDGKLSPPQLVELARARGMDYLIVTDHNTIACQDVLAQLEEDPGLILIRGVEATTFKGHFNVWGIPDWIDFRVERPDQLESALAYASAQGGLTSCNHPKPYGPDWDYHAVQNHDCVEVWNGPWTGLNYLSLQYWLDILAEGKIKPAVGGSDFHRPGELEDESERNIGTPTNWVFVPEKPTRQSILTAVRAGHLSLSDTPAGPFLELRAGEHADVLMGDSIAPPVSGQIDLTLRCLRGSGCTIELFDQNGSILEQPILFAEETFHFQINAKGRLYVRAEIKDSIGRMRALTNPIYFRTSTQA